MLKSGASSALVHEGYRLAPVPQTNLAEEGRLLATPDATREVVAWGRRPLFTVIRSPR
jgi:hypothetical protein